MSVVTMKALLESGVHFGHQTHKWNPKMDKYIFIKRNGIHILDLKQTLDAVNEAFMFVKEIASKGENVLFVGTKKQAKEAIEEAAKKCGAFYVSNRWYGGMLTNMKTIRNSIAKLDYYEQIVEDGTINSFTKLEATKMKKNYDKIINGLGGIREMERLPGAVFIVDIINEKIAVHEARKLGIPIVAMVDTNSDPDLVDYVIPANDDAIRAIHLMSNIMADAVIDGKQSMMEGADITPPEEKEKTEESAKEKVEENKEKKAEKKETKKPETKKTEKKTAKKEDKKESK
ncbi:MAG: 30S ribosomal protein S2 [Candidatus Cloacimonetes bacterium]|nr:30S ribosomal protein S2 [Candidatus Cloacimonadota bacterium]MCF7813066.1 30S ribosomal protein S2 [Candidatus Cloacimonadota bacterium]MCF7867193.1 30S ribosomal protein S2 [Candidatus Cloacimonadota bacterium]MCF7882637.1 30S ribosomal protein S2 [Candidatus Cloacimonadota bacterium]